MRIFICEYITAGGKQGYELPATLAHEGELMFTALVNDLLDAGYNDLVCTRDTRLASPPSPVKVISHGDNVWDTWQSVMRECDAAWIIAPETNQVLHRLVQLAAAENCINIGCSEDTVMLATSKRRTVAWLLQHNIATVPVFAYDQLLPDAGEGWVLKPDDGVGGEDVFYAPDVASVAGQCKKFAGRDYIIQPFVPGIAASMTVLCHKGHALLLGCNRQCFTFRADTGRLDAVIVNGCREQHENMSAVAGQIVAALGNETGCFGVDLVITEQGEIMVLEINPRLTTAYCGLRQSLGTNPAAILLAAMFADILPDKPRFQYHPVRINL